MQKIDLSVVIPGIKPQNWLPLFNQIKESIGNYSFELICVGPYFPPKELENEFNFKFIKDYGSPARSMQLGSSIANGVFICWFPEDIIIEKDSLFCCLNLIYGLNNKKHGLALRYSEGPNFTGNQHNWLEYWLAWTHESLRLKHIQQNWMLTMIFMYNLEYYREIGGIDCINFEHVNMNCHDLAFRVQRDGGNIHLSPCKVFSADWDENTYKDSHSAVQKAYDENDLPNFQKIYNSDIFDRQINIDYNNWENSPSIWNRRFSNKK